MKYYILCFFFIVATLVFAQNNKKGTDCSKKGNSSTTENKFKETWYERELRLDAEIHTRIRRKARTIQPTNVVRAREATPKVESPKVESPKAEGTYVIFKDESRRSSKIIRKKQSPQK